VDGDVDYSDAGQVIEDVDEGTIASIVASSDKTVLYIVVIVMTGVGIVMLYEILSRLAKARARRSGRLTEEQKERDQQRVQAERMNQLREVQLQRMEADHEADEEIEAQEQLKRLSAGGKDRRRKKRQSICGVSRSRPRASTASASSSSGKEAGKERRLSVGSDRNSARSGAAFPSDRRSTAVCQSAPGAGPPLSSSRGASPTEFARSSSSDPQNL